MSCEHAQREASQPVGMTQVVDSEVEVGVESDDMSESDVKGSEPSSARLSNSEMLGKLDEALNYLPAGQRKDVTSLLNEYEEVCKDKPGCTPLAVHDVDVGDASPIKQHPYRLNPSKLAKVREEVQFMLDNDIIEPSQSSWSSPIVTVPKPDGSQRFCFDYRKVNAVSKTDSFPIPRLEDCIDRVGNSAFVSKIDLLKGYWQVPMTDRAK